MLYGNTKMNRNPKQSHHLQIKSPFSVCQHVTRGFIETGRLCLFFIHTANMRNECHIYNSYNWFFFLVPIFKLAILFEIFFLFGFMTIQLFKSKVAQGNHFNIQSVENADFSTKYCHIRLYLGWKKTVVFFLLPKKTPIFFIALIELQSGIAMFVYRCRVLKAFDLQPLSDSEK